MRIKTFGIIVAATLTIVSIVIINLAYLNLNTSIEADNVWNETYTKAEERNNALFFLHQELGNEGGLNKIRGGELITDPVRIEHLKSGIANARLQLQMAKTTNEYKNGTEHYIFILQLLDQYEILIQNSQQYLNSTQPINHPIIYSNFNNEDAYKALVYFDQLLQKSLLSFSQETNSNLLYLTKNTSRETMGAAIVVLIASLASIWVLYSRLMSPLSRLQDVMSNIAVGDYSVEVPGISNNDEIGEMARSLEILRDDAAELENVKEEQLLKERYQAEIDKQRAKEESQILIEKEKNKRQTEEQRSRELADEVERQTLELRKSEASLRGVLDSALDAFISADHTGKILSFNKSAEKMFGHSAKEAVGQHVHMLVPHEFRNEHTEIFSKSTHISKPQNLGTNRKLFGLHKDGQTFPVSVGLTSMRYDGNHIFVAALRDITPEVQKEQKLQRLGSLLDRSRREVYVLDAENLAFQEVNSRAVDVLGYNVEALKGLNYTDILSQPTKDEISELLKPLLNGTIEEVVFEGTHTCEDGSKYPVEVNFHYWTNEYPPVFLAVAQDMTKRLKVRQEILDARDAAEGASKAKSFFLANMSHELRTPLNAVLGYSEMLKEIAEENNHLDYADDLDKISIAAEHLLTLINDILDLSKITSGKAEIVRHKTDVLGLVSEAGALISPLVHAGENELIIEAPDTMAPMYSDEVRIRQILINILSNASKFTKKGVIKLKVEVCKKEHQDHIKFTISDTGIGIPEDKIDSIFDVFSQVNADRETKSEGSGLGLSICRRLCRAMLGEISISSELGKGTTVQVVLPNDIGIEADKNTNNDDNVIVLTSNDFENNIGALPKQRVLIIENDLEVGTLMKAYLEVEEFQVELVHSAIEGIALIPSFNPETILLDISLPEIGDIDTMKKLNTTNDRSGTRIILCGEDEAALKDSVIDTENFIAKPIDKEILIRTVKSKTLMVNGAV